MYMCGVYVGIVSFLYVFSECHVRFHWQFVYFMGAVSA